MRHTMVSAGLFTGPSDNGSLRFVRSCMSPVPVSRCFIVGGNWNDGAKAGVASANANNALSNANDNVGSRLTKTSEITLGTDLALRQNISTNHNPSIGRTVPKTGARLSYGVIL